MPATGLVCEGSQIVKLQPSSKMSFQGLKDTNTLCNSQLFNINNTKGKQNSGRSRINPKETATFRQQSLKHFFLDLNILLNT